MAFGRRKTTTKRDNTVFLWQTTDSCRKHRNKQRPSACPRTRKISSVSRILPRVKSRHHGSNFAWKWFTVSYKNRHFIDVLSRVAYFSSAIMALLDSCHRKRVSNWRCLTTVISLAIMAKKLTLAPIAVPPGYLIGLTFFSPPPGMYIVNRVARLPD